MDLALDEYFWTPERSGQSVNGPANVLWSDEDALHTPFRVAHQALLQPDHILQIAVPELLRRGLVRTYKQWPLLWATAELWQIVSAAAGVH